MPYFSFWFHCIFLCYSFSHVNRPFALGILSTRPDVFLFSPPSWESYICYTYFFSCLGINIRFFFLSFLTSEPCMFSTQTASVYFYTLYFSIIYLCNYITYKLPCWKCVWYLDRLIYLAEVYESRCVTLSKQNSGTGKEVLDYASLVIKFIGHRSSTWNKHACM